MKTKTTDNTLGARMRARRQKIGMSSHALGDKLGVNATTIQRWELGQVAISWNQVRAVADALGVSVASLVSERGTR